MQDFSCGCHPHGDYRCREHETWPCHLPGGHTTECPPCRLERLASVQSPYEPTRTYHWRKETTDLEGFRHGKG